jgi:hypothetical protein
LISGIQNYINESFFFPGYSAMIMDGPLPSDIDGVYILQMGAYLAYRGPRIDLPEE